MKKITLSLLLDKINDRSKKERIGILAGLVILILIVWLVLVYSMTNSVKMSVLNNLFDLEAQIERNESEKTKLRTQIKDINVEEFLYQIKDIQTKLSGLKSKVDINKVLLVPKADFTDIFEEVLNKAKAIKKLEINTIEWQAVEKMKQSTKDKVLGANSALYRHGLEINFKASYKDTVKFLESIENMKWSTLYESIDYTVTAYPVADVKLVLKYMSDAEADKK